MLRKMTGGKNLSLKINRKVDLSKLPPCRSSLIAHIQRVNYRLAQWKRAHIADPQIPDPTDGHGWTKEGEFLEPVWSTGPILPSSLQDLVAASTDAAAASTAAAAASTEEESGDTNGDEDDDQVSLAGSDSDISSEDSDID